MCSIKQNWINKIKSFSFVRAYLWFFFDAANITQNQKINKWIQARALTRESKLSRKLCRTEIIYAERFYDNKWNWILGNTCFKRPMSRYLIPFSVSFFISCTKKYAQSNKLFMMFKVYGNQQKEIRKIKEILKTKIDHSCSWNILYEGGQNVLEILTWSICLWSIGYCYQPIWANPIVVLGTFHHQYTGDCSSTFPHILWSFGGFL